MFSNEVLKQISLAETKSQSACLVVVNPNNDGSILAVAKDLNNIGLPGGKVNGQETPLEAAIRETFEETGILVDKKSIIPLYCAKATTMMCFTYFSSKIIGGRLLQTTREGTPMWVNPHLLIKDGCKYKNYNLEVMNILLSTKLI